ncbi:MAG TPA: PAS domain S-box protein [Burkholderiales bacterium]|nr:PAS domain S-box protein [Burkholderiales bacterium]
MGPGRREDLRQAGERLKIALAAAHLGDWTWNAADDAVLLSERAAEIFGIPPGLPTTWQRMRELLHPDDRERARAAVDESVASRTDYAIEYRVLAKGGARWVAANGRAVYDEDGAVVGMIGVVRDVTERKRVENALRDREELLRATFAQAAVGIALIDLDTRIVETNSRFCEILGYGPGELRSMSSTEFTHPDHVAEANADVQRLLRGEISEYARERRYVRKDGRVVWLLAKVTLLKDAGAKPSRFISVIEDITQRKDAEDSVRRSEEELRALNATGRAIASQLDLETLVQTVTDAATRISGAKFGAFFYNVVNERGEAFQLYSLSGAPREAFEKFGLPRNTPVFKPTFVGEGVVRSADITRDPRYGTMAPHHGMPKGHLPVRSYLAVPVTSRSGEVIGGLFFGHPETGVFTERAERLVSGIASQAAVAIDNARLYERAQRSAAEAQRMSELKDQFLATLSHELRTPLSAILGWTQVLRRRPMEAAELQKALETIERNARMQTQLIEDLLDMSRITSGSMRLDVQPVEPASFIEAAIATVQPGADAKGVRIDRILDPKAGPISGDPARLQQVVWNLLSNAIKFTPAGGKVQVVLQRVNSQVEICVADSGIGIEPDFLGHVFERFRQADASSKRKFGGLGIGLSIVKHLVELHGGAVRVDSGGPGQGATFVVSLPTSAVHRSLEDVRVHPRTVTDSQDYRLADLSGVRFLVVDDEPDARLLIERVLRDCGAEVEGAGSAADALHRLAAGRPHVLVCDIGMPEVDGYELLKRIRSDGDLRGIPAIALTAFARSEDRTRALRAGFQFHLAKPVEPAELVATAASVAGRTPG